MTKEAYGSSSETRPLGGGGGEGGGGGGEGGGSGGVGGGIGGGGGGGVGGGWREEGDPRCTTTYSATVSSTLTRMEKTRRRNRVFAFPSPVFPSPPPITELERSMRGLLGLGPSTDAILLERASTWTDDIEQGLGWRLAVTLLKNSRRR